MKLLKHLLNFTLVDLFEDCVIINSYDDSKFCYIEFAVKEVIGDGFNVVLEQRVKEILQKKPNIQTLQMATASLQHYFANQPAKRAFLERTNLAILDVVQIENYLDIEMEPLEEIDTLSYIKILNIEPLEEQSKRYKKRAFRLRAAAGEKKEVKALLKSLKEYQFHLQEPFFSKVEGDWIFLPKAVQSYRQVVDAIQASYGIGGFTEVKTRKNCKSIFEKNTYYCIQKEKESDCKEQLGYFHSQFRHLDRSYLKFEQKNVPIFLKMVFALYTLIPHPIYFILSSEVDFRFDEELEVRRQETRSPQLQVMTKDFLGRSWELARWDQNCLHLCVNIERLVALMIESRENSRLQ